MTRDAIWRSVHPLITGLVTAVLMQPGSPGVAPEPSRSFGPAQYGPLSVPLDTIEDHPDPFLGREIRVDAEVEEVFGPRVFVIDEPGWSDFADEVLVMVPSNRLPVAVVREGDRVTITGRLQSAAEVVRDQEPASVGLNRRVDLADRSVIIASRIEVEEQKAAGTPFRPVITDANAARTRGYAHPRSGILN
jgi:hypothetical protein